MAVSTDRVETVVTGPPLNGVRSRVSWGAIMGGAVIALAVFFLLSLLGVAIGLSVSGDVDRENLSTGAAVWSFASLIIALFFGGWVSTQCTAGESRTEAVLYGIIVWAVASSLLVALAANGLRLGYQGILAQQASERPGDRAELSTQVAQAGREIGLSDEVIDDFQAAISANAADAREQVREQSNAASWWAFGGALLSLLAAIAGALFGPYEIVLHRTHYFESTTARGHMAT
jgi:hypothetical protein